MDVHRCPRFILKMFFIMKEYPKLSMPSQSVPIPKSPIDVEKLDCHLFCYVIVDESQF